MAQEFKVDWNHKQYLAEVNHAVIEVVREAAYSVEEDAKRNLERLAPDSTGTLAKQIKIETSKYKNGGYLVVAQGSGNYDVYTTKRGTIRRRWYAIFVELGTKKMRGLRYLRKALEKNKTKMRKDLNKRLGVIFGE